MVGKFGSALLSFLAFALIARTLGIERYGHYAGLVAGMELGLALASLGLDWVTGRYLPDFRMNASRSVFLSFLLQVASLQLAGLTLVAALGYLGAMALELRFGIPAALLRLYCLVLVFEGLSRLLRDQFLPLLLAQGWAQGATLLRAGLLLAAVLLLRADPVPGDVLQQIVLAEAGCAFASLCFAMLGLAGILLRHQPEPAPPKSRSGACWCAPEARHWGRLALQGYANSLLVFPSSGASLTLVAGALLGPPAAAALGFARTLVDQIRRFLPIELFLSLIRPAVVSRYLAARDFAALNRQMALTFLVSVALALPVVAVLAGAATAVAMSLGGAQFGSAGPVLGVWCLSLPLFAHRRAIEVVANTVDQAGASVRGAAVIALSPVLLALGIKLGLTLPLALCLPLLADLGFSCVVAACLRRAGFGYRLPMHTLARLLAWQTLSALLLLALLAWLPVPAVQLQLGIAIACALACGWGLPLLFKPFAPEDRAAINALLPRPWFPF